MDFLKSSLLIIVIFLTGNCIDLCNQFISYQQCISSVQIQCMWDLIRNNCHYTNDYLQGCSGFLNVMACQKQLGVPSGQIAKCRFIKSCEKIPDELTEKCYNNLSKYGCLSVKNTQQICIWKNQSCYFIEKKEQQSLIQENFDEIMYSASACSLIEHYLVIHSSLLWNLISYIPDLKLEAYKQQQRDFNIEFTDTRNYDDPNTAKMVNNYLQKNGKFVWYKFGVSNQYNLTNLQISSRLREGCIALEIQNDQDILSILSFSKEIIGVNHIYCKYLNQIPIKIEKYVFLDNKCVILDTNILTNQNLIKQYNLNCHSLDQNQCIFFNSKEFNCQITSEENEYPCIEESIGFETNCMNVFCTINQCQKLENHYIELSTNMCVDQCTTISDRMECLQNNCIYLGIKSSQKQINCAPKNVCNQISLTKQNCFLLRAKCDWISEDNRCFELQDQQISYMKCQDTQNAYVCTFISLSDQMCYWSQELMKCINILDQPLLIGHEIFIDRNSNENDEEQISLICNLNLCKYNTLIATEYDEDNRICLFDQSKFKNNLNLINKYHCLQNLKGFYQWNQEKQICFKIEQSQIINKNCNELININERFCQFGLSQSDYFVCVYDQITYSCIEKTRVEVNNYGCVGHGLSRELCLNKNIEGQFCNYSDGLCIELSINMINNLKCDFLIDINQQVCRMQQINQILCKYNELNHSCMSINWNDNIEYNYNLNKYACSAVTDSYTYFNEQINRCIKLDINDSIYFKQLKCEEYFINKKTCQKIVTEGQICIWNNSINMCKNYVDNFPACYIFKESNSKTCSSLIYKNKNELTTDYFCVYENNKCESRLEYQIDCGENLIMNIHYCSWMTGIDQDGQHVQMCAFVDYKCIQLMEDDSMDTEIILNSINCEQANSKSCYKVKTVGQYCYNTSTILSNKQLDYGCKRWERSEIYCYELIYYVSDINQFNANICSLALNECIYDSIQGCITPSSKAIFNCEDVGLSQRVCNRQTKDRRCGFINQICQYLPEYQIFMGNCNLLNQFACNSSAFIQCIWDIKSRICKSLQLSSIKQISSDYFCSADQSDVFILNGQTQCIQIEKSNYNLYSCDTAGLNKYGCHSLPTQYCQYLNNQCQFYKSIQCEDYIYECNANNSNDQYCVFKDNKCFSIANTSFNCDSFEKTNYLFCYQYTNCIYKDSQCQQVREYQKYQNCQSINNITNCTVQNSQLKCQYSQSCNDLNSQLLICPSLKGYYSRNACNYFDNCQYGYTKSGYGFCFNGSSIIELTCDLLSYDLCLEDLSHLNINLKCYWDQICKNVENENINKCNDLLQYKSSYAACIHFNNIDCKYSFNDKKCKLVNEYIDISCFGSSKLECDQIKQICYYNNNICTTSGNDEQINKYGCINKSGYYQYRQGNCILLQTINYQQSCQNLSKDACLSQITKEIHCRWINQNCQQVLKQENKMINSCQDLNQRVCQQIVLSNVQCVWNSETSICETITITNFDCTIINQSISTSISLCSSQINSNCIKHIDGTQCNIISNKINSCTLYGLNQNACLTLTTKPCIWKLLNNGGYCDDANLYQSQCEDLINEQACLNIKNINQYCKWNNNLNICQFQQITNCISASHLNQAIPCKAVLNQSCQYNQLINQCEIIQNTPTECSESYNQFACIQSIKGCVWNLNSCYQQTISNCNLFLNKFVCLNNNQVSCQWINNLCQPFSLIQPKIYCVNLPQQLNQYACQINAIDPCNLNFKLEICIPLQQYSSNFNNYVSVSELLSISNLDYPQPLLYNHCINLQTKEYCIKSRMQNQACFWSYSCQTATNFDLLKCSDSLNIFACLNITNSNQLCYWNQKCLNWSTDNPIMSNVNINVCINHSVNSIYSNYSCQNQDLHLIKCNSLGISKQTCLSIPNKPCQWDKQFNKCLEFIQDNLKNQCSDFQLVSPYVCQILQNYACIYDNNTFSCIQTIKNNSLIGISKSACLQNDYKPIYWNELNQCEELITPINCNSQLKVNSIACQSITDIACLYNNQLNQCVSQFNIWSLKCNSVGLNLKGCSLVQNEPCIFLNNKCQNFIDYESNCIMIKNVNALACASIIHSNCIYDSIRLQCDVPIYSSDICNIPGKNKNFCESNSLCKWNQEILNCQCNEYQQEICKIENKNDCKSNPNCYFNGNNCIRKQCNHLTTDICTAYLDGQTCYLNIYNECQSAIKCEDIFESKLPCSQFSFNSIQCIQVGNTCVQQNNLQTYCLYSDCSNPNCIYQFGICKSRTCSDYNIHNCNQQRDCYLDPNNICQILTSCSLINNYGEEAMNICNQLTFQGYRCNWQKISLLDETRVCTNQPCLLYGSSKNLCHGNEINGYSCVLSASLICQQCEQITEKCQCENQFKICTFLNGKCISIPCTSFLTKKQCEEVQNRCYWSTQIKEDNSIVEMCVKECIKIIDSDECNARTKECYYEPLMMKCQQGQKQVINLSKDIIIEEFYSHVINFMIIILILFL
ncbi:unnamed protein product [Paramecium sonneborni]|uniref:Transmembrane protein n=1 Tax=Paramecium sonneborni TaxID=65129 RepID=A0A8S1RDN6_9CILI|nr:unnamed protein product [Paramecium sonneborni]